jgi:hypothetical protein
MDIYTARIGGGVKQREPGAPDCDPLAEGDCRQSGAAPSVGSPVQTGTEGSGNAPSTGRVTLSVAALSARQRRALAAGRRVKVKVRVGAGGRISVRGRARIHGFEVMVLSASRNARGTGLVEVAVRLSKPARRQIAAGGVLRVRLTVRLEGAGRASVRSVRLEKKGTVGKRRVKTRRSARLRAAATTGRASK